ncbi:MAG TPA: hypothetical protein VNJ03_06995 [Vicinamibacterales bacterium]|nr:hypothetical protein [Vicinamibacterales bacterium]
MCACWPRSAIAPRVHEQVALLLLLSDDADPSIARTARDTIDRLPVMAIGRFIGRKDVPEPMRTFFVARGIAPIEGAYLEDEPLVDPDQEAVETLEETAADPAVLAGLPVIQRMKLAMKGTREQRGQLIRDPNKLVAVAVLSSPKITEAEIEAYARQANLSEDVLRIIATSRAWVKNYNVVAGLTRNPKTPRALAMGFLQRLNEKDLKQLSTDRNVSEPVRLAARKYLGQGKR